MKKQYRLPIIMWLLFEAIAIILWLSLNNMFYLINFTYIGTCLAVGLFLLVIKFKYARHFIQFAVGAYMLIYLGFISQENMQIAGFWYYLFLGAFEAAVIHYLIAKIFGPLFFGRGWCGYACWTAMVLDLLPYKLPKEPRKSFGFVRFIVFTASLIFVAALFLFHVPNLDKVIFWSFIIGNVLYYGAGIALALILKDNRAFCKYICPITTFLKPASYFAFLRVKNDEDKCVSCNICKKVCPMNVDMTNNSRKRLNGTECILCLNCVHECPKSALHT